MSKGAQHRFSAADARNLSGPTVTERVDEALLLIRAAAENKKRSCALHDDFWVHGGYSKTKEWSAAVDQLKALGFTVDFFYEERQFVNMFTEVKW